MGIYLPTSTCVLRLSQKTLIHRGFLRLKLFKVAFRGSLTQQQWDVTTWHVTPMQNLFQASSYCGGSHGILTDLQMRSGRSKDQGGQGVFMHGCPHQAGRYPSRNRMEWPAEPCCILERQASQLKNVKGGAKKSYVATGEPGRCNPKVRILFLLLLQSRPGRCAWEGVRENAWNFTCEISFSASSRWLHRSIRLLSGDARALRWQIRARDGLPVCS